MPLLNLGVAWALLGPTLGCHRHAPALVEPTQRAEAEMIMGRYEAVRLEPAGVAPPSLADPRGMASLEGLSATAELVRAEDAEWNQWPGPTVRLFNNRTAHLFHLEIVAETPVRWVPEHTRLELNEHGNALYAASSQEALLEDLLFWAYQEQRTVLDGDLALRARAAGPLREAYLTPERDEILSGLIAFPIARNTENEGFLGPGDPADYHVVSMRLTVALETETGRQDLVFLLR